MLRVIFKTSYQTEQLNAKEIPVGRAFAYRHETGFKYLKLTDNVFLGETGTVFGIEDFDKGTGVHYVLLPRGTTITITT